jgi:hypothetical protein
VGSLNGRLRRLEERLEGLMPEPKDEAAELRRRIHIAILDELSYLKSVRAHGLPRTGEPNIPPFDEAGEILGYPYTAGQLMELAVRRVFERLIEEGAISEEEAERFIAGYTEKYKNQVAKLEPRRSWDKVEATGPP